MARKWTAQQRKDWSAYMRRRWATKRAESRVPPTPSAEDRARRADAFAAVHATQVTRWEVTLTTPQLMDLIQRSDPHDTFRIRRAE